MLNWARLGLEDGYNDAVISDTSVVLGWPDRVRVLFHGRLSVYTRTLTEYEPGMVKRVESRVTVPRLRPCRKMGEVAAQLREGRGNDD